MRKPELLVPASSLEVLKIAAVFGADAVYIGGEAFGLRAKARNFSKEEMAQGIAFAHEHGVKVYVTVNILAHNYDLEGVREYLKELKELKPDALIIADPGIFTYAKEICPEIERHISTQANNTNYETYRFWYNLGAKRVVSARELSLEEIRQIRANIPDDMEIETFIHGAMCISYSGRCLLSNYMTGRDSNRGQCAQPCRYQYALMEEKRPGEYFPVFEDEKGTYIMNSRDMCMIDHLDELCDAGIDCLKIEGRAKSAYYAAIVTGAYRHVLDDVWAGRTPDRIWRDEVEHVSHRHYSTGFYYGQPGQFTENSRYLREWQICAVVEKCDAEGNAVLSLRNKFAAGDTVEVVGPDLRPFSWQVPPVEDPDGVPLLEPRTPQMRFRAKLPKRVPPLSFIRHAVELSGR